MRFETASGHAFCSARGMFRTFLIGFFLATPLASLGCSSSSPSDSDRPPPDAGDHDTGVPGADAADRPDHASDSAVATVDGSDAANSGDGATGSGDTGGSPDADQDDTGSQGDTDAPAAFADVQAIFDSACVTCHSTTARGLSTYADLPLNDGASYAALVNQPAHETCGGTLVVPGKPDQSYLFHKVNDATPCDGARMPRAFEILKPVPLGAAALATLRAWIEQGALP